MSTVAYADPPYLGQAKRHYGDDTFDSIDAHRDLLDSLEKFDAWAYSLSSSTLKDLLPLAPAGARVGAWVKPFCVYKRGVDPVYAWEPVLFKSKRQAKIPPKGGKAVSVKDFVSANITLKKGLIGAKPPEFCFWMFDLIGAQPDDDFHDLFPGTGGVSSAWDEWSRVRISPLMTNRVEA